MIAWIFWTIYLLGYVACWRTVVWYMACEGSSAPVDGAGLVFGVLTGTLITFAWPVIFVLIVTGRVASHLYSTRGDSLTACVVPRAERRKYELRESRRALDERERRIAELEREVGIR